MTTIFARPLALALALSIGAAACGSDSDTADAAVEDDTTSETTAAADESETTTGEDASETDETASTSGAANTTEVVAPADALMAALSDDELDALLYDFGDASLASTWSNLPACGDSARPGIAYGDLTDDQLAAALAVSQAALSEEGYTEYTQIIAADDVLGSDSSGPGATTWNSECYYLAFYGTPSETDEWAMMFGGHHYARIVTYTGDVATITPAFTGVEPTSFEVDGTTVEPMADEVDGMFAIFATFDDDQLSASEIDGVFDDVLLGPGEDTFPDSVGILGSELSDEQKALVLVSVESWIDDFDDSIADEVMATIEAELDATYFSWATAIDSGTENAYGRIDGPSAWIEVAVQAGAGTTEVHYHSIYRNKTTDYGNAG